MILQIVFDLRPQRKYIRLKNILPLAIKMYCIIVLYWDIILSYDI